ncbi:MAG: ABC transporter substrate-binding protein [Gammaproteobacteria bacterium]
MGEPRNHRQSSKAGIGAGHYRLRNLENNPEKVFGVSKDWADKYPNTHIAVVKALIRAAYWLDEDNNKNRKEAVKYLSQPNYVGADYNVIANSMTGTFEYEKGDKRELLDSTYSLPPQRDLSVLQRCDLVLTQMRR